MKAPDQPSPKRESWSDETKEDAMKRVLLANDSTLRVVRIPGEHGIFSFLDDLSPLRPTYATFRVQQSRVWIVCVFLRVVVERRACTVFGVRQTSS